MLFTGKGSVRMVKNCDLGLENAALGLRPRAVFSRPRSQFFTIRTDPLPANNIYVLYNLIVKLSTAILLLVESESLVWSRKLNLSEIFLVLLVPGFDLKLSEMLEFCRI